MRITWSTGEVPTDGMDVYIPQGVAVMYDGVSETSINVIGVDGKLHFDTTADSKLVVDTLLTGNTSVLEIGTQENPVPADVNIDIVIANNGDIDVSWDPTLVSRGVVTHGTVDIHGAEKTTHLKVANDPMAGDKTITLSENPQGWEVGDTIVLAGTRYSFQNPQDEVLTITKTEGNVLHFDTPLEYNHDAPRDDLKTSVANYTRNVSIESEDGAASETHHRGHVMFMHNDDVDVRYTEFSELGRSDKSQDGFSASEFDPILPDSNVKGRYSFHFHRTGVDDIESPAIAEGNAVFGSPGWGYVHHDANAVFHDNASYDTFGAGFVAETGNEIGSWSDNIAIWAEGSTSLDVKQATDSSGFDAGNTGEGYHFRGRMVESVDNIAASVNTAYAFVHRGRSEAQAEEGQDHVLNFDREIFDLPDVFAPDRQVGPNQAPILHFDGNEAFASTTGIHVFKANPNQGHDLHSDLTNFTGWSIHAGARMEYTTHYTLSNFDLVSVENSPWHATAISFGNLSVDMNIVNSTIEGFSNGVAATEANQGRFTVYNVDFIDVDQEIKNATVTPVGGEPQDAIRVITEEEYEEGRFEINFTQSDIVSGVLDIEGTKTDSLGTIDLDLGSNSYDRGGVDLWNWVKNDGGYYQGSDDKYYMIFPTYFEDRATTEIHKFGLKIELPDSVTSRYTPLGNGAVFRGEIDLDSVAPITADDAAMTMMETDVIINVLANDIDPDGEDIYVDGILQPVNGRVFDNEDGTITYRPDLEFTGIESFKYWTTDGQGNFTPAIVTVTVHDEHAHADTGNIIPVAQDDSIIAQENTPIIIDVLANDFDLNGDTLSVVSLAEPENGTAVLNDDGTITYTPNPGFYGADQVSYTITDGTMNAGGDIVLTVYGQDGGAGRLRGEIFLGAHDTLDDALVAAQNNDRDAEFLSSRSRHLGYAPGLTRFIGEEDTLTSGLEGVSVHSGFLMRLSGKMFLEAGTHTFDLWGEINPDNINHQILIDGQDITNNEGVVGSTFRGSIEIESDGYYDIELNYLNDDAVNGAFFNVGHGVDGAPPGDLDYSRMLYRGSDNLYPEATDDSGFMVDAGEMVMINLADLLGNDSDPDGDALSITSLQNITGGTAMIMNGMVHFTADADAEGMGGFEYTLSDGNGDTDTGSVSVMVHAASMDDMGDDGHDHGDDGHDGHNHGDMGDSTYGNVTLAEAIASQQMLMDHGAHAHGDNAALAGEHGMLLDLFPMADADTTAVALNSGSWFDATTWSTNEVPTEGMNVYIPQGVAVLYDGVSDTSINVIGVDGKLHFDTTADSKLVVDTLLTGNTSVLEIGTQDNPVPADVNIDIVIANNGDIDVSWDPTLVSRGVVTHGTVDIHGAEKTTHLKVANDPMAGDSSLTLAEAPEGWQIGDTIVIAGTHHVGWQYDGAERATIYKGSEDEVVTITSIDGSTVHFDTALQYNHDTPRDDLKTSVANYTRNVSIESEDGAASETHHRGHVMFMHNDDVDVRYVEFAELGRTDKSETALNSVEFDPIQSDSNVKGRYSMHFHRTGVDNIENPAIAEGNAVFGSPGWGYVHHDSNAIFHDNASFGTLGAGFVAETGNEIGSWSSNIAINAEGRTAPPTKSSSDWVNFDTAIGGAGFYFQGRMVENFDNIAASTNQGFIFWHRGWSDDAVGVVTYDEDGNRVVTRTNSWLVQDDDEVVKLDGNISFENELFDLPDALGSPTQKVGVNQVPILHFQGNEAFATKTGFGVTKGNPHQGHDIHTHIKDFEAWNVGSGIELEYTAHYTFEDIDIVGQEGYRATGGGYAGISVGNNTHDITFINGTVDNFEYGAQFAVDSARPAEGRNYNVVDIEFNNIAGQEVRAYGDHGDALYQSIDVLNLADLPDYEFGVALDIDLVYDLTTRRVAIEGTKTDGLGEINLVTESTSGHLERFDADLHEVIAIMKTDGYFTGPDGKFYFVLPDYYTDRANGEIHKFGYLVEMPMSAEEIRVNFQGNAIYKGEIDFDNAAPIAQNDSAVTELETDVIIDLLANDSDADGDTLVVDGILQPHGGRVFDNGDGTVTYRPDLEFTGVDSFKYWTSDDNGNFTPAVVTVEVKDSMADMHDDTMMHDHSSHDHSHMSGHDHDMAMDDALYGTDDQVDMFVIDTLDDSLTTINNFNASEGDMIDISAVLQEYDPADDLISDFVQLTQDADDTVISIDVDGGADNFAQAIVVVDNTDFDLQAMISDSQLLV